MKIEELTAKDISEMDYNQLIGIVKETNRPPGGKNSIFEMINRTHITEKSHILEIGASTGFTSIEISRLIQCKITAIDINEASLSEARERADKEGYSNIKFINADVNSLPFEDNSFDIVIVGNVFSLMADKKKALDECMRVCKKDGFLVVIPMYYLKTPSDKLVEDVSNAIKVQITPLYKKDWVDFFSIPSLEIYWIKDFKFDYIKDENIMQFCEDILKREHLKNLGKDALEKLREVYPKFMFLFRDNLSQMGYSILLLSKKKIWEDSELYTSFEIK
ncbi:MAG: methyltransferase domain-containing protein [Nanoarchaeota archaeon]